MPEPATLTVKHAQKAQGAVAAIAHVTAGGPMSPAEAHELLGELALTVTRLTDVLRQVGNGVRQAPTHYQVTAADGSDPSRDVVLAQALMQGCADHLTSITDDLWRAQDALAGMGVTRSWPAGEEVVF